ncbi:glycosyl hydrolase, partial [candidate division KSB1 bacterium]
QSDLVWTDDFFQQFKKVKGYDLRQNLPVIFRNAGKRTPKIRCDYYDVFTKLYISSWFKQISEWCGERGIYYTGHTYEDVNSYMSQGDFFRAWEPVQVPGTDNEDFRYTFPRKIGWFKPKHIASIAHTTGKKRIMGEILGGAGWGVTLEELRYGIGMLGVYGLNLFIPHLFHYSIDRPQSMDDWPNSWFYRNPYWKYFKTFADYMRRVSFMGSQGKHICDIAVLFPITSQWASGVTAVHENLDPGGGYFGGKLQNDYMMMQEILLRNNWDFDVVHPEYFAKSIIEEKRFHAGDGSYHILLLPPLTTIRHSVLRKMEEFLLQGGIIIAIGQLPADSWEGGKNDPEVLRVMQKIFRVNPRTIRSGYDETMPDFSTDYIINSYPDTSVSRDIEVKSTGVAYFTKKILSVPDIVTTHNTPSDICVLEGDKDSFKYLHRKAGNVDIYNVMNSSKKKCSWIINFRAAGKPEIWDPVSGEREAYYNYIPVGENRTKVKLDLRPWENIYIVFNPGKEKIVLPSSLIHKTNLKDAKVSKVESGKVFVNGWVSSKEDQWSIDGETDSRQFSGKGYVTDIPEEQLVKGPWKFLMTPKNLDYRWAVDVTEQVVELPVMSFRIERKTGESEHSGWVENIRDTKGWKDVKLFDSLHPDKGCSRYASLWDAHWVTYYDYRQFPGDMGYGEGETLYFRKLFKIEDQPAGGRINIAADGLYTVYLNGKVQGKGKEWNSAKLIDLTSSLKQGVNLLEVVIRMDKKIAASNVNINELQGSLLLQGEIHSNLDKLVSIFSDENCEVSRDSVNWFPAYKLVYPPQGRYGDPRLRGKKIAYPVTLWYRQILPPGSTNILSPDIGGKYELYINGKVIPGPYSWPLSIKEWCGSNKDVIALKVQANSGSDGIRKPLNFVVKPVEKTLQDWSSMGIGWYSGRGMYSTGFTLPNDFADQNRRWMLDLGKVNFFTEVWINGKLVAAKSWPPFIVNVTPYLRTGENKLNIVVSNLIANKMRWNIFDDAITWTRSRWWHDGSIIREAEKLGSGLLGPVRLILYQKVEVTAPLHNSNIDE